jgi:hypothetical protein
VSFAFDPRKLTDAELERLLAYFRGAGLATGPRHPSALDEHIARHGRGLTVEGTLGLIRAAVLAERWLIYKEIADHVGRRWGQGAMGEVNQHLGALCEWAHHRGLPMFSAWIVRKDALPKGKLEGSAPRGFVDCVMSLGLNPRAPSANSRPSLRLSAPASEPGRSHRHE